MTSNDSDKYQTGWRNDDDTSFWSGLDTLEYYCNLEWPCDMWLRYCDDYKLCYDIRASALWLDTKDIGYVLYWSGLQISYEHQYVGTYMEQQNVQKWSSQDNDFSSCAKDNGGGWYALNNCKGVRFTSKGLCIDLETKTKCYKDWTWKVVRS